METSAVKLTRHYNDSNLSPEAALCPTNSKMNNNSVGVCRTILGI